LWFVLIRHLEIDVDISPKILSEFGANPKHWIAERTSA